MKIRHFPQNSAGYFQATEEEKNLGKITYTRKNNIITLDHTEVSPEFEGKGIGKELVMAAVAYARENNVKIIPQCSFANAIFKRVPAINDVLAG